MGKYTELDDGVIEKAVDEVLKDIIDRLVTSLHPRSIILAGSFGRGEATIIKRDGGLQFLSDCEIVLAGNRYFSRRRIQETLEPVTDGENRPHFVIRSSIALPVYSYLPLRPVLWKPTIWNYDLKYATRKLYGTDYLAKIPDLEAGQIPAGEGIRLVFNRLAEALEYFPLDTGATSPEQEQTTAFWVTKIILACQDALLIGSGKYHTSCRFRNNTFREVAGKDFKELLIQAPGFVSLATRATDYKLNRETYWKDIRKLWFDAAEVCDSVLRYLLKEHLGTDVKGYPELKDKGFRHPAARRILALGGKLSAKSPVLSMPPLIRAGGPWTQVLYPAVALVYFSLSRDGTINRPLLEAGREVLSLFQKMAPAREDPYEEWQYLKDVTYNTWYALGR